MTTRLAGVVRRWLPAPALCGAGLLAWAPIVPSDAAHADEVRAEQEGSASLQVDPELGLQEWAFEAEAGVAATHLAADFPAPGSKRGSWTALGFGPAYGVAFGYTSWSGISMGVAGRVVRASRPSYEADGGGLSAVGDAPSDFVSTTLTPWLGYEQGSHRFKARISGMSHLIQAASGGDTLVADSTQYGLDYTYVWSRSPAWERAPTLALTFTPAERVDGAYDELFQVSSVAVGLFLNVAYDIEEDHGVARRGRAREGRR